MKIRCNDGIIREFIPTQIPNTKFVYQSKPAYCKHCGEEFTRQASLEQKLLWKDHSCKFGTRKKTKK